MSAPDDLPPPPTPNSESARKPKAPSVRRACIACHTGKTRCSEVLPCQSCLKRGLGQSCAYADPNAAPPSTASPHTIDPAAFSISAASPPSYAAAPPPPPPPPTTTTTQYYADYNGQYTGASSSTFRPAKRPRNLTEEETHAITRGFQRGDFYVGTSAPVRIDPRLPVRLTLGDGDHVHFTVGEALV